MWLGFFGSNWVLVGQIGPRLVKLGPVGSDVGLAGQVGSWWFRSVPGGSGWPTGKGIV